MRNRTYSTKELSRLSTEELIAKKRRISGSYETCNPNSHTSMLIRLINCIIGQRGERIPATNNCWGSNHGGKPTGE